MKALLRFALVLILATSGLVFGQGRQNNRQQQRAASLTQNLLSAISDLYDPLVLIFRKDVQHDLEMDLGQRGKFDHLLDQHNYALQVAQAQGRRNPNAVSSTVSAQKAETQTKIDSILTDPQKARLNQISLQLQANTALLDPSVQKQLAVTSDEKTRIDGIKGVRDQEIAELQRGLTAGEVPNNMASSQIDQIIKEMNTSLADVLTDEQTTQLKALGGKPFKPSSR